ncbi:GUN4 domain-containing protein [Pseudanabaena minima]|uniref:GUN4 domain-containing protein n=1 Tax=Pseudanabaena minima TaxID=890415 RepID=UPI003DAA4D50
MTQEPESQQNSNGKRRIKIYRRTYDLPVLGGENLDELQNAIKSGSEALQRGYIIKKVRQQVMVEQKGGFLGMSKKLVPKFIEETVKQELKFEERFQQLDSLVKNYDAVIASLTEHQDDYQEFFGQLADEIREIVTLKCQEIASVEQDRLEVEQIAQADWDDDLLQITAQQKIEILETAKTIGYAAILMLKKLDLMSLSLNKIANDQQTQKQVLESMVKKLSGQKKAYEVQLKIKRLQDEAKELANIALNFEDYMKKFMGSFQTLLGNVANVDKELSGAMQEIKQIAEMTMNQQSATLPMNDRSSQKILDFLVASDLKKERLIEALEQAKNLNSQVDFDQQLKDASPSLSLADCLDNIQTYVQFELKPILNVRAEREKQKQAEQEAKLKKFQKLEKYLKNQQWYEADQETWKLMLKVTNREEKRYLELDNIRNFPCEDLLTLDRLWVEYSKKHGFEFGFSVQKQIYVECGGKLDFSYPSNEIWDKFCDRTAWKSEGMLVNYPQPFFKNNLMNVNGHLPWMVDRECPFMMTHPLHIFSHQDL